MQCVARATRGPENKLIQRQPKTLRRWIPIFIGMMTFLHHRHALLGSASNGGANNANNRSVTSEELAQVVDRVLVGNAQLETRYQNAIKAASNFSDPPTAAEVQAIIDLENQDLSYLFSGDRDFNDNYVTGWDVSNVTDMRQMFRYTDAFNQDIGDWDVGNVTDMGGMFVWASSFNQDIGDWDVSNVVDMSMMFAVHYNTPSAFNQDIGDWDVGNVTHMGSMFQLAPDFDQDISGWDVSNVTDMGSMFDGADAFNQDIGYWDVSNVTDMSYMFHKADSFNQDISGWDVSNVTNMLVMFSSAKSFNQDISDWDISSVINASGMLTNSGMSVENFDHLLAGWSTLDTAAGETNINSGLRLGADGLTYSDATSHHQLTDVYGWSIGGTLASGVTVGTAAA